MSGFAPIVVRQPQPNDLVDQSIMVCGIRSGFEGTFAARVCDANGNQIVQVAIDAGGTGIWSNFVTTIDLGGVPATPRGTLEVFEPSAAQEGGELHKVTIPVVFGSALINPYTGFMQYAVKSGDTLSAIAQEFYSDGTLWPRIFEANREEVDNPDRIFPGQVLRIPT